MRRIVSIRCVEADDAGSTGHGFKGILKAMSRSTLKGEIRWRVEFVVNDCNTYIFMRKEKSDWYTTHQPPLGGGNFLMAHGLFAALNFMGKVYAHLKHRERYFHTVQNIADVKDAIKKLKSVSILDAIAVVEPNFNLKALLHSKAPTRWKEGVPGECINETNVFNLFYQAFQPEIDLGFPEGESNAVWSSFRNRLSHMAAPNKVIESGGDPLTACRIVDGEWRVNVDRLTSDLILIWNWLARQIDQHSDEDDIRRTLHWINPAMYSAVDLVTTTTVSETVTAPTTSSTETTFSMTYPPDEPVQRKG
jgi:hypothetical protein